MVWFKIIMAIFITLFLLLLFLTFNDKKKMSRKKIFTLVLIFLLGVVIAVGPVPKQEFITMNIFNWLL
jgi:uncharacterized membrane protein YcaP (DUF421 family)